MDRSTYNTHRDLLDQVESDRATRDNIRRILSEPLTEADLDAQEKWKRAPFAVGATNHAHRYSRACSLCESGMHYCASPQACQLADEPRPQKRAGDLLTVLALLLASWAAVAFVLLATMGSWL